MKPIQTFQRSVSITITDSHSCHNQTIDVNKVRNVQPNLEFYAMTSRTLDALGIDDNRNKLSHLNQEQYNVFVRKDKSGKPDLNHGAYVSKKGEDEYADFRWLNPRGLKKYQTNDLTQVNLSKENLIQIQNTYKNEKPTKFLVNLLRGDSVKPSDNVYTTTYKQNPKIFYYSSPLTKGNGFLIYPNIPYMSESYINGQHKDLVAKREGIQLTAWAIHPDLPQSLIQEITIGNSTAKPSLPHPQVEELNQSEAESKWKVKSLTSILDLGSDDVSMLEKLKSDTIQHLSDTYGASIEKDSINLFFHFPVAPSTATLHLHIWVNKGNHPLNESRAFGLDDVIQHLRKGENINTLILSRNEGQFTLPKKDGLHFIKGMPNSHSPKIEVRKNLTLPIVED